MSDMIFKEFYEYAEKNLTLGLPLLISGGCGLNCEWNTKWKKSGLFPEIFIPPCANDSGSSIGTAIDAQRFYTNKSKIKWSVYAGQEFIMDNTNLEDDFIVMDLNLEFLASLLHQGKIFAWVQGKYEMGPRALGNRSLLASPFNSLTKDRINKIKERERFRPVAPVCLEEDVGLHFEWSGPSPYMLFFQTVRNKQLEAITHVDGTARVQTVNKDQNFLLHELLAEFRKQSGVGVLCNTSLNYSRRGFINQMRDLVFYSKARGLDGFVVSQKMYLSTKNNSQI
jgi:hydroxymethyl cephem carbamoyltransferase